MERLRCIGSAVVDDDLLRLMGIEAEVLMEVHLVQILRGELLGYVQVDEARHDRRDLGEHHDVTLLHGLQLLHHLVCDIHRLLVILLRTGHRTVRLILAEVRTVGNRHATELSIIACQHKRSPYGVGDNVKNRSQIYTPLTMP